MWIVGLNSPVQGGGEPRSCMAVNMPAGGDARAEPLGRIRQDRKFEAGAPEPIGRLGVC
jgi:hypothetical protein